MSRLNSYVGLVAFMFVPAAAYAVNMQTVYVGNVGNAPDTRYTSQGYGAVDHAYRMGKYEVTTAQYVEFLNAVAADDPYGLYSEGMWTHYKGCKIEQLGTAGSYTYQVASDWADRPVNWTSWADAARFANWMHNGQPTGPEGLNTTEDGSYYLNGITDYADFGSVTRKANATWVIPSENEWYKAAYHKNNGVTGDYYNYPTSSDTEPSSQVLTPDPGNNANHSYAIDLPYLRTVVGEFENTTSPYGVFDFAGNVAEWNEGGPGYARGVRGGSCINPGWHSRADIRYTYYATTEADVGFGFRLAYVPEPASLGLLALLLGTLRRRS